MIVNEKPQEVNTKCVTQSEMKQKDDVAHESASSDQKNLEKTEGLNKRTEGKLRIVEVATCVLAIVLSIISIYQTNKITNITYKPILTVDSVREIWEYDNSGRHTDLVGPVKTENSSFELTEKIKAIDNRMDDNDRLIEGKIVAISSLKIVNIGSGVAQNISLKWNEKDIARIYKEILVQEEAFKDDGSFDGAPFYYYPDRNEKGFQFGDVDEKYYERKSYMMPNYQESYVIDIPAVYSFLFAKHLLSQHEEVKDDVSVSLKVTFSGLQGKHYEEDITLTATDFQYISRNRFTYRIITEVTDPKTVKSDRKIISDDDKYRENHNVNLED